jgi:hypothetical protein
MEIEKTKTKIQTLLKQFKCYNCNSKEVLEYIINKNISYICQNCHSLGFICPCCGKKMKLINSVKYHCKSHSICFFCHNSPDFKKCILHFEEDEIEDEFEEDEKPRVIEFTQEGERSTNEEEIEFTQESEGSTNEEEIEFTQESEESMNEEGIEFTQEDEGSTNEEEIKFTQEDEESMNEEGIKSSQKGEGSTNEEEIESTPESEESMNEEEFFEHEIEWMYEEKLSIQDRNLILNSKREANRLIRLGYVPLSLAPCLTEKWNSLSEETKDLLIKSFSNLQLVCKCL